MVRFKIGVLDRPVFLCSGDRFNLTYTESDTGVEVSRLLHSEEITRTCAYNCFAVLDLPVGMGMVLGHCEHELREFLESTWPGCEVPRNKGIL